MRSCLVDAEILTQQILVAGKRLAKENVFLTVKALRKLGVTGNETRIYRIRKQLVDAGLLPSDLIREHPHPIHRFNRKRDQPLPEEASRMAAEPLSFTQQMVRLYGGRRRLRREFARSEAGASMVEYGLLLALIVLVCIGAIALFGNSIADLFSSIASKI
jgi:pilus assembly protein Flp/PilA